MEPRRNLFGLSAQAKALLIEKLSSTPPERSPRVVRRSPENEDRTARLDVSKLEGFREIRMIRDAAEFLGISDPFFRVHEGIAGAGIGMANVAERLKVIYGDAARIMIDGREGGGTLVRLRLPILPNPEELMTPAALAPAPFGKSLRKAE